MSIPAIGTKVYLTANGDTAPYFVVTAIRQIDMTTVAMLEPWPFGRAAPENIQSYGIAGLSAAGDQTL